MRTTPKKTLIALVALTLVIVGAGAAYAYWTTDGDGVGTAETGTSTAIVATQTSTISDMGPGIDPQPLSGDFTNSNEAAVYVTTVTASIVSVDKASGAAAGDCLVADYALAGAAMTVDQEVQPGTGGAWSGATIAFVNSGTNQDGCKGATVNLAYAIS